MDYSTKWTACDLTVSISWKMSICFIWSKNFTINFKLFIQGKIKSMCVWDLCYAKAVIKYHRQSKGMQQTNRWAAWWKRNNIRPRIMDCDRITDAKCVGEDYDKKIDDSRIKGNRRNWKWMIDLLHSASSPASWPDSPSLEIRELQCCIAKDRQRDLYLYTNSRIYRIWLLKRTERCRSRQLPPMWSTVGLFVRLLLMHEQKYCSRDSCSTIH
jgi:hypothetical protein